MNPEQANDLLLQRLADREAERTGTRFVWIARHSAKALRDGLCSRKAYRFEAREVWDFVRCPDCGGVMPRLARVEGRFSEGRKCDPRCTGATGGSCDCQCGGVNHGADHGVAS